MKLIDSLFGINVKEGTEICLKLEDFEGNIRKGEYYKIKGYRGAFRHATKIESEASKYFGFFIRENVPKSYIGNIEKLTRMITKPCV